MRNSKTASMKAVNNAWKSSFLFKLLLIIVLFAILTATTFAWLGINKQTDTQNVNMRVSVSPNLVISDSSSTITGYSVASITNSYIEKTWSDSARELVPVDHYDSTTYPLLEGDNLYNLVYNTNPENVDRDTGKGDGLEFDFVPEDGENVYFIDKIVYIASLGKEMIKNTDYSSVTFTIVEIGAGTTTNVAYKSASIDVYIAGLYKGTLNLDTLDQFIVSDLNSIPLNTSGSVEIILRCYFDGALQRDNSTNYVNSTSLTTNTTDISFDISIEAN